MNFKASRADARQALRIVGNDAGGLPGEVAASKGRRVYCNFHLIVTPSLRGARRHQRENHGSLSVRSLQFVGESVVYPWSASVYHQCGTTRRNTLAAVPRLHAHLKANLQPRKDQYPSSRIFPEFTNTIPNGKPCLNRRQRSSSKQTQIHAPPSNKGLAPPPAPPGPPLPPVAPETFSPRRLLHPGNSSHGAD
ncbi:hypothetical protein E2C01_031859 [Portunus trituberculatus]|uniref:Uncharacterized protein n=1 Tax=Portunus trituberculatus TaxID=210409 RepID=A0A5B7EZR7_PORTR|nr:hypothetical protein [Portunus trituberculatus]